MSADVKKDEPSVSVVISTFNRADLLPDTLASLARQRDAPPFEVVVVDNNSADATQRVFSECGRRYGSRFRYVFEKRQGLSFGRNTGIAASVGEIVAFTDDDIVVSDDWIACLLEGFRTHPTTVYVGGKVLPRWPYPPPSWLTPDHWAPLATVDYGQESLTSDARRPVCLVGANIAFRRAVFDQVGMFDTRTQRVADGIGSIEDYELQLRIWRAGEHGRYLPTALVWSPVARERLTKAYHRRWHTGHGQFLASLKFYELARFPWGPLDEATEFLKFRGVPAYLYRQAFHALFQAMRLGTPESRRFERECEWRQLASYILASWRLEAVSGAPPLHTEIRRFSAAYARKHFGTRQNA